MVKLFHGMSRSYFVGVMSLVLAIRYFQALSHVRCLIVGIKHLAGYKLRSAKICFLQCPLDIGFVCPDIVEECSRIGSSVFLTEEYLSGVQSKLLIAGGLIAVMLARRFGFIFWASTANEMELPVVTTSGRSPITS